MSIYRKLGIITALGSSTAALAMLTGLAGARADDLQINQKLLDNRIDQLAAVGVNPGAGNQFSIDQNSAAGAPVTAGSFPRSILIPGTDTSIKIYGQMTLISDYWMSGGPANGSPYSSTIGPTGNLESVPLNNTTAKARSNGIFQMVPRESKIGFESRTPTPFGEARTVMEFDWNGGGSYAPGGGAPLQVSDSLLPRIRYAYGTLGGLLAGQASSNFSDPDANTETIDFGGDAGTPGVVRLPQIRYTMPAWWGASFSVSAESPETGIATASGLIANDAGVSSAAVSPGTNACTTTAAGATCTVGALFTINPAKATAPDLDRGVVSAAALGPCRFLRRPSARPRLHRRPFLRQAVYRLRRPFGRGREARLAGLGERRHRLQIVGGKGIGRISTPRTARHWRQISVRPARTALDDHWRCGRRGRCRGDQRQAGRKTACRSVTSIGGWTICGATSPAVWSISTFPPSLVSKSTLNKELYTFHANLIWNPVSSVDIGLEYMWGQRRTISDANGQYNALISEFNFRF